MNRYSVVEMLFEASQQFPDRIAIEKQYKRLSYRELENHSNSLANHLIRNGAGKGSIIAVSLDDVTELIVAIIGILKAGCVFAPIDPGASKYRLEQMISTISPDWIISETEHKDRFYGVTDGGEQNAKFILIDGEEGRSIRDGDFNRRTVPIEPADRCYIYFTSGSTGRPKAIVGCHKGLAHFIKWEIKTFDVDESFRISQLHPPSFDPFLRDVFVPLCAGGTVCVPEGKETILDAKKLADWIESSEVNLIHCIPTLFRGIINEEPGPKRFNSLKYILLAGEPLFPSDVKRWINVFDDRIQLVNLYGPTETTLAKFCHFIKLADKSGKFIPVGKPIEGARALILRDDKTICPPGVVGEVYIRTPFRTLGYYNQPELTKEVFIQNPFSSDPQDIIYKTGDMGRMAEDGNFELLGRKDHQVKIRGIRIEIGEIEKLLREHEGVEDAVVKAWEDSNNEKFLCAYVVSDRELQSDELRNFLSDYLPENAIPSGFVRLEALPRNLNGKVDRKALPDPKASIQAQVEYVAPSNEVERKLLEIWQSVLQVERFGVKHNFFELGGHSLKATQVVSRIKREFQISLPLGALFESPTVAGLTAIIEERLTNENGLFDLVPLVPVGTDRPLVLSFAQQRLWFLNQLRSDSTIYNIPAAIGLKGRLNVNALKQTLGEIVRRHQVLRSAFADFDGEPFQIIAKSLEVKMPIIDLQELPEPEREAEAKRLAGEESKGRFNLAEPPLIRTLLMQLGEQEHVIVFTMHHIVCDGWSMGVLVREVTELYEAYCKGRISPLPDLEIQYADFTIWQRECLQGPAYESLVSYWKDKLRGMPRLLDLPTDRRRLAVQSERGDYLNFALSESLSNRIRELSRQEGATMFMTLLAAYKVFLFRYSNQTDILVGTPIANRNRSELEPLIGFFVNTLVLRSDLSGSPSFRELLRRVRQMTLAAFAHQDLPFEKLVELLQPERSLSHSPLFQVMFGLQNNPRATLQLPGLELSQVEIENNTAKFDLTLMMDDTGREVRGTFEYNSDLFDRSTICRMIAHFQELLEAIVREPDQRISCLPMITAGERQQIAQWNNTQTIFPGPACLHHIIEAQVARTPEAVAALYKDERLTYKELNSRANQLAHYLIEQGVGPEVLVGICMHRSLQMMVALLAVLKAGGAYVPIDPDYPADRQRYMLDDSGAELVVSQDDVADKMSHYNGKLIRIDREWEQITTRSDHNPETEVCEQNLAYVIYTSGSTGRPKGAMNTHAGISNRLMWMAREYEVGPSERVMQKTPMSFDVSVWEIFLALIAGGRVVIAEPGGHRDVAYLVRVIKEEGVTMMHFVPSMLRVFLEGEGVEGITSLRVVVSSGEELSKEMVERYYGRMEARLENLYGPTEAAVDVTRWGCERERARRGVKIGKGISNIKIEILDEEMGQVGVGVRGEVYIGGIGVGRGYLGRGEMTAERYTCDPYGEEEGGRLYRTGDEGRYDEEGEIEYLGRGDRQVKVRGYRIELGEIEAELMKEEGVKEAEVIAREEGEERRVVGYVVVEEGGEERGREIRERLKGRMPEYMVPSAIVVMEQMPLTPNGKVDRKKLTTLNISRTDERKTFTPPRDYIELNLKHIWEGVLAIEPISIDENFFELGGHSLLAARVIAQIRNQFGQELPLATLFQEATIEGLARILRQRDTTFISPLVKIQQGSSKQPFFCVHPSGGNVLCYMDLARFMGPEQSFYGLQDPPRLNGDQKFYGNIEEMASCYVESIRTVQSQGPYLLGGYSFGGVVAYEMAQQLTRLGEQVALLAILDSGAPINARQIIELEDRMGINDSVMLATNIIDQARRGGKEPPFVLSDLLRLEPERQLSYIVDLAKKADVLPPEIGLVEIDVYLQLQRSRREVVRNYIPQDYPGRITLFRTTEPSNDGLSSFYETSEPELLASLLREQEIVLSSPTLGWEQLSAEPIELHLVPGDHHTMLFEPNVALLAERLGELISKAEASALIAC